MEQWRQALGLANAQREAIAELRGRLLEGRVTLADVLGDRVTSRLTVERVIGWQHRWGPIKTHELLAALEIWPNKLCGQLSQRQRQEIEDRAR